MKVIDLYNIYVKDTENVNLFDSTEDFMQVYRDNASVIDMELMALYGQRDFYNPFDTVDIFLYWKNCWLAFIARNKHNFQRMWDDLNTMYDFDVLFKRDVIRDTEYLGGEDEDVELGQGISTSVYGEVPNDSASGNYKDVNKSTNTDNARHNKNETRFVDRKDKETEHTSGNTGVYTNTDLLEREYKFRVRNDFFIDIFSKFLAEVTIYG